MTSRVLQPVIYSVPILLEPDAVLSSLDESMLVGNAVNINIFLSFRDIESGKELTYDYKLHLAKENEVRIKCRCKADCCKGYMT